MSYHKQQKQIKAMQHSIDSMSQPEEPETPEADDIPHQFWRSTCCGKPVTHVQGSRGVLCDECGLFCKVDDERSNDAWIGDEQ